MRTQQYWAILERLLMRTQESLAGHHCLSLAVRPTILRQEGVVATSVFVQQYAGKEYCAELEKVMGAEVRVLRANSGETFFAPNLTTRKGCKAHSCLDQRVRLLDRRLGSLAVGAPDELILAIVKRFFASLCRSAHLFPLLFLKIRYIHQMPS
jgi:hypothetical protein